MLNLYLMLLDTDDERSRFTKLYEKYKRLMHYVAHRVLDDDHLAEDAVQEAFFRIAKNFSKINEIDCPQTRSFVVVIVRRVALTMSGKQKQEADIEDYAETLKVDDGVFAGVERRELTEAILALPEIYRNVLYLNGFYEYTPAETANLLGISVETARKRLQRARKMLKESLEKGEENHGK